MLVALPVAILLGAPLLVRAGATLWGVPALLVWMTGGVVLTSVVMAAIGVLDRRRDALAPPPGRRP